VSRLSEADGTARSAVVTSRCSSILSVRPSLSFDREGEDEEGSKGTLRPSVKLSRTVTSSEIFDDEFIDESRFAQKAQKSLSEI